MVQPTDLIPSGSWTLYFHQADAEKWTIDTFIKIQVCHTWNDILWLLNEIDINTFKNGLIFFMKGETLPLWENYQNIRGGSYSIKVPSEFIKEIFTNQLLQAMVGHAFLEEGNECMGLSMSPKKGTFNILKIWNKDAEKYNVSNGLSFLDARCGDSEVIYTPHVQKRM